MRIELGSPVMTASVPSGATGALDTARSRRNMLRTLVRAHQDLVAAQWQLTQAGGPADPRIERDLAAVAERITGVLSNGQESRSEIEPPTRAGDEVSIDSLKETPGVTQSGGWLSRKDWRRALHLYLDGRITRSEFEKMKERLTRVRASAIGRARPPQEPRLQLVPGGLLSTTPFRW